MQSMRLRNKMREVKSNKKNPLTKNELEGYIWQNNENQFYHSVTKYLNENNT